MAGYSSVKFGWSLPEVSVLGSIGYLDKPQWRAVVSTIFLHLVKTELIQVVWGTHLSGKKCEKKHYN